MSKPTENRRKFVGAVVDGVQTNGFSGLVTAVGRMIGENQPPIDCFRQADIDFGGAQTGEQYWDAALSLADCLRDAKLGQDIEVPETPEPPPTPPQPDRTHSLADVVLAGLLLNLREESNKGSAVQYRQTEQV